MVWKLDDIICLPALSLMIVIQPHMLKAILTVDR